jgi:hypothetical protein
MRGRGVPFGHSTCVDGSGEPRWPRGGPCSLPRGSIIADRHGSCCRPDSVPDGVLCCGLWRRGQKQLDATARLPLVWGRQFRNKAGTTDTGGRRQHQGKDRPRDGCRRRRLAGGVCCSGRQSLSGVSLFGSAPCSSQPREGSGKVGEMPNTTRQAGRGQPRRRENREKIINDGQIDLV